MLVKTIQTCGRFQLVPKFGAQYDFEVSQTCELSHDCLVREMAKSQSFPGIMYRVRIGVLENDPHSLECFQLRRGKIVDEPAQTQNSIGSNELRGRTGFLKTA